MTTIPSSRKRRPTLDINSGTASYNSASSDSSTPADGSAFVPLPDGTSPRRQQNRPSMHAPQHQQQQELKGHDFHHHTRRRRQKSCFFQAFVTTSILLFVGLSVLLQKATLSSSSSSSLYIRNARELMVEALVIAEPSAAVALSAALAPSVPAIRRPKVHKPMSVAFHVPKTKMKSTAIKPAGIAAQNEKFERRAKRAVVGIDGDYGGLNMTSLQPSHLDPEHREEPYQSPPPREIPTNAYDLYELERNTTLANMDAQQPKLQPKYRNDEDINGPVLCRRNNWRSRIFPVCNHFHESTLDRNYERSGGDSGSSNGSTQQRHQLQEYKIEFRGHGYFRDSWLFQRPDTYGSGGGTSTSKTTTGWSNNRSSSSSFVWKSMRLKEYFDYDYDMMYQIHQEAIVMERLTSSERIVDMYGHCGTSIFAEHMKEDVTPGIVPGSGYMLQKDLDKLETTDVYPMNNLTLVEKLDMALVMAESLADIHGYKGGVIVHGDVHPDQWLRSATGQVKLNDFNNGEILDYFETGDRYCKVFRCFGGTFRSPEEFRCIRANEAMDTYSMGNNIYSLLTGLWPFYNFPEDDEEVVQNLLIDQKIRPLVDPRYRTRSFIESKLVAIMEECWEWEPERRISIFDVVRQLRELHLATAIS